MQANIVICLVDYYQSCKFFLRLAREDKKRKYLFVTNSISIFYYLHSEGYTTKLVTKFSDRSTHLEIDKTDLISTREIALKLMSIADAKSYAEKLAKAIDQIVLKYHLGKISLLTWNSSTIMGVVMKKSKDVYANVSTIYCEISNIKGKLFIDPDGVNAASSLFYNPAKLYNYPANIESFSTWKKQFIRGKLLPQNLPQSKKIKELKLWHFIDFIFLSLFGYKTFSTSSVYNKLAAKLKKNKKIIKGRVGIKDNYVFFPMQVSTDTQIKLNSDIDNLKMLEILKQNEEGVIVVKPHPAEPDFNYILDFVNQNPDRFIISDRNTYELIKNSKKVVTINSTVGLESLIFDKEVQFYGRTFYKNFNQDLMARYIQSYLISVDFFEGKEKSISQEIIDQIFSRA